MFFSVFARIAESWKRKFVVQGKDRTNRKQDQPDDGESPPAEGEGSPQPQEGEMTPEEAERLLDAIEEDPEDVNRKPASARGRKPRKPW